MMSQQSEQQWTEHTALEVPSGQYGGGGGRDTASRIARQSSVQTTKILSSSAGQVSFHIACNAFKLHWLRHYSHLGALSLESSNMMQIVLDCQFITNVHYHCV